MIAFLPVRRTALVLPLILLAGPALAGDWTVDRENSSLSFVATQNGVPLDGRFSDWTADITLDPENLSSARIEAHVRTGWATTGQAQIDGTLPGAAWFDVASTPEAVFTSSTVTATGGGAYEAAGELSIKGISRPFVLPFTLSIDDDTARAKAEVSVARLAYSVGSGIPAGTVADEVKIVLDIIATR